MPRTLATAGDGWHKDHFVVELIAHDSGATPPATYYRLNGGPTATYEDGIDVTSEGMNVLEWWSVDGVGNTEETQSVDVGIDKTAPATTSDVRSHYNATAVVTLTSSDAHSGFPRIYYSLDGSFPTTPYTAPVSIANEGQTLLSYYAVDAVGNAEGVKTELVTVDETAPGTASDVSSAWYKDSATVSLTASDTLTGVASTHYSVAGAPETTYTAPFTISAEGPTAITFWSIDAAGNAEATKSATVRVDKTAPVTTSSPLGSFYGTASATLTATDPYSGVAYTRYRLDGSDWTTGTAVSTSAAGYHTLQYASTDNVGHTESVVTTGFTVYGRYEQTASNLYFTGTWATGNSSSYSGGSYKYTTSGGVFRVAFNGTGVDWITSKGSSFGIASVSLDGADPVLVDLYNPTNLHKQRVWSSGSLANGYHTLRIAWTGQRNASAGNSYVGVDALDIAGAPASDVAAPATTSTIDAAWHNANVTVTLTGTDALAGVQNTYYRLGAGATTTYTAPFTVSAEGVTPVTFWSVDAAGNAETAQSAAVRIDKTAPGSAADADNAWHPGDVSVSVTASDAVSGLGTTFYQLNGAAVTTCTGPVNVSAEGANTLAYWSVDAAGNAEATKTATVRIDRTFPSTASNADTAWHKATFPLTLTASDTPAGLAASYYTVNGGADTTYTGPVSISAEGTNTVVFWSVDRAGNAESRGSAQVLIDLTAPVTSSDATSSYTSTATIHLTASDPLSGVASTSWRADGGAWSSEPVAVVSTPGQHVIEYYSSDVAGNAETHQTRTFTIWKRYEQTEPTLYYEGKWLDASNAAYSGGSYRYMTAAGAANVTFSGTQMTWVTSKGTSFGIARVSVDGGAPTQVDLYSATTQHRQAVWSTGALADGPHTVRIEWTGQRNASATNNYVGVDALDIAGVPTPKRYEQTDPLQYYDGTWYDASNASYSGGSYKYTNSGYTMVSFTGTRIDWITTKGTVFGIAQVSVDGGAPVEVDLYAPSTVHKQRVWSAEGLANTPHTVRIDWTGAKNASASAANVGVDAFDIVGQPMGARYEQSDPSIYLEGTWLEGTSSNYSGGTYRYTNGGNAAVTFAGTSIDWVTTKGPVFGIARVSIDGGAGTDVDLYAATTAYKQKVWSATGLTPGQHTLRIEWTGTKNTAATAANVGIDAVDIVGRPTLAHYEQTATDLRFEGSWLTGTSSSYSGASYKYTFSAGSAVNIAFRGTRIDWITSKGPSFGIARVAVDNGAPVLVDLYAASTANKRVVWSATGLASGLHHVRIEWTGTKNAAATGTNVGIDALDILGVLAPAEDGPMVTRFDEASPQLGWTGGWRTSSSSSFSGGTYRYTAEEGTLTVSFTGTRIDWIGTKTPRSGIASVSVDGGAPVQVDLYAASNVHQQRLWSATGLSEGDHTVTISWTGQHAASASDAYISVDALDIVGTLRQVQ